MRFPGLRRLTLAAALTAAGASSAAAQASPACAAADCTPPARIWTPAAQIHEIKNQFVADVRQLAEALAGTYGDEGREVVSGIGSLKRTIDLWDGDIAAYETMLKTLGETAEVHVALGTVYLDRTRADAALGEFAEASRLDPRRADAHRLSALAYDLQSQPGETARALREAAAIDQGNPVTLYGLARQLLKSGQADQAGDALRLFQAAAQRRPGRPGADGAPVFERVGLLRQVASVAPIFPLDRYREAFERILAGDYGGAVASFTTAAAGDPLVASPRDEALDEGAAALRKGALPAAIAAFERAAARTPDRSEAHRVLGVAYWADEQYDRSAAELAAAISLAPHDERSRLALADTLADAGRFDEAERALEAAIRELPGSGEAHYRLGRLYQRRSLLPEATREFEAAAALQPIVGLDWLYDSIGALYANQANFDRALDAYTKREDVNPNSAVAHRKLAEIYFLQGNDDEALAESTAALLIDPKDASAIGGTAQVLLRMGRWTEALEAAKRTLARSPRDKDATFVLATSLMRLGQADEGRKQLEAFQRLQEEDIARTRRQSESRLLRRDAAARLDRRQFAEAAALLSKAIEYEPDAADLYRDLGLALIRIGQPKEAAQALDKALRLEPDTAEGHQLQAEAFAALGRAGDSERERGLAARLVGQRKIDRLRKAGGSR